MKFFGGGIKTTLIVLLDSEAFWKSFITTDYVRKIFTPFLVVEFNWGFLRPFKFLRFFVVLVLLGMGVLPTDTEPMFIKEVELPGNQQEGSGCRVGWAFPVISVPVCRRGMSVSLTLSMRGGVDGWRA